jgi:hypothetical protein
LPQILFRFSQNDGPYLFTACHQASEYRNLYGFGTKLGKHGELLILKYHCTKHTDYLQFNFQILTIKKLQMGKKVIKHRPNIVS